VRASKNGTVLTPCLRIRDGVVLTNDGTMRKIVREERYSEENPQTFPLAF